MNPLLLVLLIHGLAMMYFFGRIHLGRRLAFSMALLVFLASTGQMSYARAHAEPLLVWLGVLPADGVARSLWWMLSFYAPVPVAAVLAIWLAIEIANDFPFQGPRLPRCRKCRYDLRGNVSGICPECGEPITKRH